MLVTESQQQQIEQCISEIETKTDAELVCVLAARSDPYYYISAVWAACIAFLAPIPLGFFTEWFHLSFILFLQAGTFITGFLLLRWPPLLTYFIPKPVRYWYATNLARRQFLAQNLHHTQGATGVLIFISEAEHYVEIMADRGIHQHVPNETWQHIVDELITQIKQQRTFPGLLTCLDQCGALLAQHVPATHQKNELPNRLVIL